MKMLRIWTRSQAVAMDSRSYCLTADCL